MARHRDPVPPGARDSSIQLQGLQLVVAGLFTRAFFVWSRAADEFVVSYRLPFNGDSNLTLCALASLSSPPTAAPASAPPSWAWSSPLAVTTFISSATPRPSA